MNRLPSPTDVAYGQASRLCAARSTTDHYFISETELINALRADGGDLITSYSLAPFWEDIELPAPGTWGDISNVPNRTLNRWHDGNHTGQRVLRLNAMGNDSQRTSHLQRATFQLALQESDVALWILVGGYVGEGDDRAPAANIPAQTSSGFTGSSLCDDAAPLCLFAPWRVEGRDDTATKIGTSHATPQVAAALDTVWAVWPDMDVLDLRNLAFDCAENMAAPEGEDPPPRAATPTRTAAASRPTPIPPGVTASSRMTCLFTPNGGLQNPVTGNCGLWRDLTGPWPGLITGASITGVDYTGRDFGYGFARPVARENYALASLTQAAPREGAATANFSAGQPISGFPAQRFGRAAYQGRIAQIGRFSVDLTAAAPRGGGGNAIGIATQWQVGNLTIRSGMATQPEGVGSLIGSRAFRAPSTVSAAITAAYGRTLTHGFSAHLQADHWRTLATRGRSLWEGADIHESRLTAALVKRFGSHEFALQGVWRSGLSGSLDVDGRRWALDPLAESGVWVTWLQFR